MSSIYKKYIIAGIIAGIVGVGGMIYSIYIFKHYSFEEKKTSIQIPKKPQISKPQINPQDYLYRDKETFLGKKKHKIKPIIPEVEITVTEPKDEFSEQEWTNYYESLYKQMKENTDPQYLKKLQKEIKKRYPQDTDRKMDAVDKQIKEIKEKLKEDPDNEYLKEELKNLIKLKAHYRAFKNTFIR